MTSRTFFRHLSPFLLPLLLLLPLAGCGPRADKEEPAKPAGEEAGAAAESPDQPQGRGGRGRRHEPKGHVTLAGAVTLDQDVPVGCSASPDKGLEVVLNPEGEGPQVRLQLASVSPDGEHPATVVVHNAGADLNGSAKVQIRSRVAGGGKRTFYNGTFSGTYEGAGGKGTLNGQFQRCAVRGQDQ